MSRHAPSPPRAASNHSSSARPQSSLHLHRPACAAQSQCTRPLWWLPELEHLQTRRKSHPTLTTTTSIRCRPSPTPHSHLTLHTPHLASHPTPHTSHLTPHTPNPPHRIPRGKPHGHWAGLGSRCALVVSTHVASSPEQNALVQIRAILRPLCCRPVLCLWHASGLALELVVRLCAQLLQAPLALLDLPLRLRLLSHSLHLPTTNAKFTPTVGTPKSTPIVGTPKSTPTVDTSKSGLLSWLIGK